MPNIDLCYMGLSELSVLLLKRDVSATEVTQTFLERIDRLQPRLKAYITVCREEALATAKIIDDSRVKGNTTGQPMAGIPVALKDQFATRGILTTNGSAALKDHIPQQDATVVSNLKKAGAIILGKLNMYEFAAAGGENPPFGSARNPWNTAYSPGYSSSGSGSAVSAGLCTLSMAEDSGGSCRIPASFCGVVSIRPSAGLVSRYGVHPLSPSLDTPGPMGRTVSDCAALLQAVAGYDPLDPLSSKRPVPNYASTLNKGIKGVRVGVIKEFWGDPNLDSEIKSAIQTAMAVMTELGALVEEVSIPYIDFSMYALGIILWCDCACLNRHWVEARYDLFQPSTRIGFVASSLLPSKAYLEARQAQYLIRSKVLEAFQKYDLLLCPTSPKLPPKIDDTLMKPNLPVKNDMVTRHSAGHTGFSPLSGCPAISVPCGFSKSGLPIGMQIAGRPFEDGLVLQAAHAYEQSTTWHTRHPDL